MSELSPDGPIGVFDSGVGGLSVWRELVARLPHEDTVYFADQANVPYGPRGEDEIRALCDGITRYLIRHGCKAIVVACNTASAAALKHLRECYPTLPSIGLEPAVKPAAALTRSGVVGIMATPATFAGRLFQATAGRHAGHVKLVNQVCDGLASRVEAGLIDDPGTRELLHRCLEPMLAAGADTIVLACTHYPFVLDAIRAIAGEHVTVIDPAPAVVRHVERVLDERGLLTRRLRPGRHAFLTTGDAASLRHALATLVAIDAEPLAVTLAPEIAAANRPTVSTL